MAKVHKKRIVKKKIKNLPSTMEMDEKILEIMDENLSTENGIICNRFATSLKIIRYFKKIYGTRKV